MAWKFVFDKHNRNRTSYNMNLTDLKLVLYVWIFGQKLMPYEESLVQNTVSKYTSLGSFLFPPRYNVALWTLLFIVFFSSKLSKYSELMHITTFFLLTPPRRLSPVPSCEYTWFLWNV